MPVDFTSKKAKGSLENTLKDDKSIAMKNCVASANIIPNSEKIAYKIKEEINNAIITNKSGIAKMFTNIETGEIMLKKFTFSGNSPSHTAMEAEAKIEKLYTRLPQRVDLFILLIRSTLSMRGTIYTMESTEIKESIKP